MAKDKRDIGTRADKNQYLQGEMQEVLWRSRKVPGKSLKADIKNANH